MLKHERRPPTAEESRRFDALARGSWLEKAFFKEALRRRAEAERLVDEYDVCVGKCIIPANQDESEVPVYFLDLDGKVLALGGQWLDDPYVTTMPDNHFDDWAETEGKAFFAKRFILCGHAALGIAFSLTVLEPVLIPAEHTAVPLQFNRLKEFEVLDGSAESLIDDLQRVGLAEPESQRIRRR